MKRTEKLNALEIALNNERREREFYLKNAVRCGNILGSTMFKQIADDELEHYKRLQQVHAAWSDEGKWPETVPLKVKETKVKDILKEMVKKTEITQPGEKDDFDAISIALDFEAKGEKFYAGLRDAVTNPMEKKFFDLLAGMEREHFLSLKDTEEYLKDPVSWFTRKEHHGIDGA
jgi:rubrerythrin